MTERVRITDVAPRDGLQNEPGVIATEDKIRLIELLTWTGVAEVEATSFVSPKWTPQLGDAGEVMSALRDDITLAEGVALSVLVPNEKGFQRAAAFHSDHFPLKIAVFTAASETFSQKNTNATIAETVERFRAFLPEAFRAGMAVRMYVSCAVACPFEGAIAPDVVRRTADALLELAPADAIEERRVELDLGDTIGVAHPRDIDALLDQFEDLPPGVELALHLHDTYGRAGACAVHGAERGVRRFDASAGGLGGCPYAGTKEKPAPGNISTLALVEALEAAGFPTDVDRARMRQAADFARRIVSGARTGAAS